MLNEDELRALEDFRFKSRMPSRADELLRRGLAAEGYFGESNGTKSRDYGVLDQPDGQG